MTTTTMTMAMTTTTTTTNDDDDDDIDGVSVISQDSAPLNIWLQKNFIECLLYFISNNTKHLLRRDILIRLWWRRVERFDTI